MEDYTIKPIGAITTNDRQKHIDFFMYKVTIHLFPDTAEVAELADALG
ncbi:MAG: hypothetical protein MRK02_09640 [Candidatus Scalindua sp.]|nr:hypothetical protein [Candidatus Scalindua sp.]